MSKPDNSITRLILLKQGKRNGNLKKTFKRELEIKSMERAWIMIKNQGVCTWDKPISGNDMEDTAIDSLA